MDLQGLAAGDDAGLTPRDSLANYRTGAQEEPFPEAFPKKSGALKAELPESVPLGAPRKWTVLAYISGDNNLEGPEVHSLLQLEKIGSNEDVHVVAQLDRREIPDDYSQYRLGVDGDWSGARRYYITKGAQEPSDVKYHLENAEPYAEIQFKVKTIQSPVVQDLGEVDIADKKTFKDFLTWGMKSFPAEHYLVVMMDHGYGYMGTMHDVSPGNLMTLPEMRQGLEEAEKETGRKVDILGLDCCLMGLAETAYELKDAASVVIASQQFEIVPGWPIAQILTNLQTGSKDKAMPVRDVAKMIVGESAKTPFSTPTLSAVDSSRIADVKLAAEALARDLLEPKISGYYVRRAMKDAKYYATASDLPMGDQADLVDLGMKISAHPKVTNEKIKGDTENLRKAVENAVIAEQHSAEEEGSHGLSIYASYLQKAYDPLKSKNPITGLVEDTQRFSYRKLAFAQNSPWEEFLRNKFKIVS